MNKNGSGGGDGGGMIDNGGDDSMKTWEVWKWKYKQKLYEYV